ncbi:MAG: methyltransferase domain-containing protein [Candidatus Dormibacter sp.]
MGRNIPGRDRALEEFLDTFADHEEQWAGSLHLKVAARLVDLAHPQPGEACLDIGGGDGIVAAALSEAVGPGTLVVSIDLGRRSVELTEARAGGNTHRIKGSGGDVMFRDHTFDVVVLSRSISYESDPYAVIGEATRTLKVGGRLALFCRRRGLATPAEEAFLDELAVFLRQQGVTLPERFLSYPGLADRRELELALRMAGLEHITFGDVVTGGQTADAAAFNAEMMACWPAARIVLGSLAGRKRVQFDEQIDGVMRALGDEAFRYHHPYLLAAGTKAGALP